MKIAVARLLEFFASIYKGASHAPEGRHRSMKMRQTGDRLRYAAAGRRSAQRSGETGATSLREPARESDPRVCQAPPFVARSGVRSSTPLGARIPVSCRAGHACQPSASNPLTTGADAMEWSRPGFVDGLPHAAPGVCVVTSCSYTTGATYPSAELRRCRLLT